jgi:tetratricopeptide (TPR) repeat protein
MPPSIPVSRNLSIKALILHYFLVFSFILIWTKADSENSIFLGCATYLAILIFLRNTLGGLHKKGIRLSKQFKFSEAIPFFEKSYAFFKRNDWIDKYRYITVLSASKWTYKELALTSIAFCYGQLGDAKKAEEYYERTLQEFPDNGLALTSLNLIRTVRTENQ